MNKTEDVIAALLAILDAVDFTRGACSVTEMVGAVLPVELITNARNAIKQARDNMCPSDVELSLEEQLEMQLEIQEYQIADLEKLLKKAEEEIELWKSREQMCYCGTPMSSHYYQMGEHTAVPMISPCPFEEDVEMWRWCCANPDKLHYIIESIRNNVIAFSEHGKALKYNVDLVMKESRNED